VASVEKRQIEALSRLAETRAALELAWSTGDGQGDFHRSLKETILKQLAALDAAVKTAASDAELESIERRCRQLANQRAYWLDAPEVQADAEAATREMRTWGIPERYFDEHLKPLLDTVRIAIAEASLATEPTKYAAALRKAQATLEAIFGEYQYWDWYTSKYVNGVLSFIVGIVGVLGAGSILTALILAFAYHRNALAMFFAGLAGTCVSILLKQEPLAVYGDVVKSLIWSIGRLLTGVIATVVGMGLLTSGFINVGFSSEVGNSERLVPLHVVVRGCIEKKVPHCEGSPARLDGGTNAGPSDAGARDAGRARGDGGSIRVQADGGVARSRSDGGVRRDGGPDEQVASQKEIANAPPSADSHCDDPRCSTSALLLMLGLAMLFGFSERAFSRILAQFDDKVAGGSPPSTVPPRSIPTPVPPQGSAGSAQAAQPKPAPAKPPDPPAQSSGPAAPSPPPAVPKAPGTPGS
jgi:hypothetical protein